LKLAVAEGRTYGAETKKDTAAVERLRTTDRAERPSRTGAAGSRLTSERLREHDIRTHRAATLTRREDRKGSAENRILQVPCRKD
jgi:hypothetical protein